MKTKPLITCGVCGTLFTPDQADLAERCCSYVQIGEVRKNLDPSTNSVVVIVKCWGSDVWYVTRNLDEPRGQVEVTKADVNLLLNRTRRVLGGLDGRVESDQEGA